MREELIYLDEPETWSRAFVDKVSAHPEIIKRLGLSDSQQDLIYKSEGVSLFGGTLGGGYDFEQVGLVPVEETLQDTLNKLDTPWTTQLINTTRYSLSKKDAAIMKELIAWAEEAKDKGWSDFEEDETISCKDSGSGVKCKKVKQGKHFKPFYNSNRW